MPLATVQYRNEYLAYTTPGGVDVWLPFGVEGPLREKLTEKRWLSRADDPLTIRTVAFFLSQDEAERAGLPADGVTFTDEPWVDNDRWSIKAA